MAHISVVIPNYNGARWLPACLDALRRQVRPPDEIIVVDDASTDGSPGLVRAAYPEVTVLSMPFNGGFCRAANAGLRVARGEYVALFNNDTVAHPDCVAESVSALDRQPTIGSIAPKMLLADHPDHINSAGLFYRVDGVSRDIGFGVPDGADFARTRPVFGASGGAAVYRRAMLDDIGMFDEDLEAYAEDVDLSFRAQLRCWPCLYVPTAVVYHHVGASYGQESPTKVYLTSRNMLTVLLKNMPTPLLLRHGHQILAAQAYQILYYSFKGQASAVLHGKRDAIMQMQRTLVKRRAGQRCRRASDVYLLGLLSAWGEHGRMAGRAQSAGLQR